MQEQKSKEWETTGDGDTEEHGRPQRWWTTDHGTPQRTTGDHETTQEAAGYHGEPQGGHACLKKMINDKTVFAQ